ncbi:RusA family crossover junction endodeoxyribonuclease [Nitratireductor aquimarinus]|uniref:RusA family crossover junction endodeoxyribonuclease n=1 Tax=Nitratireductor aquimarinus TaxID=889300 RepID=UPI001A8CE551|nr:RusA family crossover junction endodeoxyribonuclease [Nitratireductor aquimarinus]MBN8241740.1 RusA family crossover junction endodeoxyribonuclease [Nitratireductor aquimarinus]MBY6130126.1 RusA family crossover junction endodeoxyribonuclease [Nitratireductor aquimarinus]MCA1304254.1 RusA family crossover junction endodeoxyribonuclease [Nitratireductor aquimarinus]
MVRIELPYPPTANNLFINAGRKRVKSPQYKTWIVMASLSVKDSHRQYIGPYSISIAAKRPDKRKRDIANLEKAVSDLLVTNGVIQDDSLCERITMTWDAGINADCVVIVTPFEEGLAA